MKKSNNKTKVPAPNEGNLDPQKIEHRAYQLYVERGREPGHDCDDWLQAERDLEEVAQVPMSPGTEKQPGGQAKFNHVL
ncbi:MAG: DUF2934 domain-containing protein [Opitutaceae bacterium]